MPAQLSVVQGEGPSYAPAATAHTGFASLRPLRYLVSDSGAGEHRAHIVDLDHTVGARDRLVYHVFPEYDVAAGSRRTATTESAGFGAAAVAVDLVFADGSRLSDTELRDHHGFLATAAAQAASKTLIVDQWNRKEIRLATLAGRRVVAVELALAADGNQSEIAGWLSDITVTAYDAEPARRPSDHVVTTRGTHSSGLLSRGLTAPATAVPHGFNFYLPVTDASTERWLYSYQQAGADGRPRLQAFAVSHQPSPWMGDRGMVHFMPGSGRPTADRAHRALTFGHEAETARAHRYDVTFDGGIRVALAPTDHAMIAEISYPTDDAVLVFDQIDGDGALHLDATGGAITGHTDAGSARPDGAPRMYFRFEVDAPVLDRGLLPAADREGVCGYVRLDLSGDRTVRLRLATSYLGLEQAARNLQAEIGAEDTVESVAGRAQRQWDDLLGIIEVEGASDDQLTTLYSNLYRLYLYPNSSFENAGTPDSLDFRYASPFRPLERPHTDDRTGSPVVAGTVYVNNGFWDTYRTAWPAYALFTPARAAELLDGFVEHFRDGGWMARWSSPGYADCMVGTSSDVVVADALAKRIELPDLEAAYDSAVKDATVPSDDVAVGRKGLQHGIFTGYVDTDTAEGMSWSLESAVNDFGLMVASELLRDSLGAGHPRAAEFAANAVYFRSRALSYRLVFDDAVGFFQGRLPSGAFRHHAGDYDPRHWGGDYTETNAWGMAFTVPHDGAGLAALHGGPDALRRKLDAFFSAPETASEEFKGSYGHVIHEMTEARNVRMGMFGVSNQPAHHIPYMYLFAGAPHRTQEIVRESLSRLFLGSEIGQGYPGDEDNGEMSAWWIFGALGFYPLTVGSPTYAVTSPLFTRATVNLPGDKKIVVNAPNNSPANLYIQSMRVDGQRWRSTSLPHDLLAGGCVIDVELGPEPSAWGADAPPPSLSDETGSPGLPLRDILDSASVSVGSGDADAVVDDTSSTEVVAPVGWWLVHTASEPVTVGIYTITAGVDPDRAPSAWVLEGSDDGRSWAPLDSQAGASFRWARQTRAFLIAEPAPYRRHRLRLTGDLEAAIAQLELLA